MSSPLKDVDWSDFERNHMPAIKEAARAAYEKKILAAKIKWLRTLSARAERNEEFAAAQMFFLAAQELAAEYFDPPEL